MDPIGLTLGILPLFHSCLEYFQLFKTAQSATLDIQILLFQLDCHHEDLIIWGEKHGFFNEAQPQTERSGDTFRRLETALRLLEILFKDSSALHERYGVAVSDDADGPATTEQCRAYPSSTALRRLNWWKSQGAKLRNYSGTQPGKASFGVLQKTRWAIYDKGKFEGLITKIGEIVGQIEKILPIPDEFRNQTALHDIMPLIEDLSCLKLFQTASASIRPAWSNAASGLIIASEAASVRGPGTISRWIEQVDDGDETRPDEPKPLQPRAVSNAKPQEPNFQVGHKSLWSLWFAFLPTCPSSSMGLSCKTACLELDTDCPAFINNDDFAKKWGLGPKIESTVTKRQDIEDVQVMLEKLSNMNYEIQEKMAALFDPVVRTSSKMRIYCAPCRCAIRTALILSSQNITGNPTLVRIDDRIPSTCCDAQGITEQLRSFIATINARELRQGAWFPPDSRQVDVDHLDKEWIENRVYALESELYEGEVNEDRFKNVGQFLDDIEKDQHMHSVVLLEATGGAWILQTPPFRKSCLMAKQLEVFNYRCPKSIPYRGDPFEKKDIYRGTFTPSKLNFPAQEFEVPRNKRQRQN